MRDGRGGKGEALKGRLRAVNAKKLLPGRNDAGRGTGDCAKNHAARLYWLRCKSIKCAGVRGIRRIEHERHAAKSPGNGASVCACRTGVDRRGIVGQEDGMTDIRAARNVLRRKRSGILPPLRSLWRIIFEPLRSLGGETPFCGIARLESTAAPRESANKGQTPGRNRRWRSAPHPDDASLSENSAVTNDWSDMKTDKAPPAFFFTDMGVKPVIAVFGKKHASAFPKNAPGASVRCSRVEICLKFCRMCLSGPFTTWRSQFPTGAHGPRVLHRTDKKFPQN